MMQASKVVGMSSTYEVIYEALIELHCCNCEKPILPGDHFITWPEVRTPERTVKRPPVCRACAPFQEA